MILTDDAFDQICRGQEMFETFFSELAKGYRVRYAYMTQDGSTFSTVAKTLAEARARKDRWMQSRKVGATA